MYDGQVRSICIWPQRVLTRAPRGGRKGRGTEEEEEDEEERTAAIHDASCVRWQRQRRPFSVRDAGQAQSFCAASAVPPSSTRLLEEHSIGSPLAVEPITIGRCAPQRLGRSSWEEASSQSSISCGPPRQPPGVPVGWCMQSQVTSPASIMQMGCRIFERTSPPSRSASHCHTWPCAGRQSAIPHPSTVAPPCDLKDCLPNPSPRGLPLPSSWALSVCWCGAALLLHAGPSLLTHGGDVPYRSWTGLLVAPACLCVSLHLPPPSGRAIWPISVCPSARSSTESQLLYLSPHLPPSVTPESHQHLNFNFSLCLPTPVLRYNGFKSLHVFKLPRLF